MVESLVTPASEDPLKPLDLVGRLLKRIADEDSAIVSAEERG